MEFRLLGRTNLQVSLMSLGTGGHSRIGQSKGRTQEESIAVVEKALDLGINLIDTYELYGTEELVGRAIPKEKRADIVLSTKGGIYAGKERKKAHQLEMSLIASLARLQTDYVDIYHLHAVTHGDYGYVLMELVPVLLKLKQQGKIRFIGITEGFASDPSHKMLQRAVLDDCWDVMMAKDREALISIFERVDSVSDN